LFVAQSLRNLDRADVGIGDPEILRLAAREAAEHM
jgi:hypothetical protein